MWKKSDTIQYAKTGAINCRVTSDTPGIREGLRVRLYEGRGGSSSESVVLVDICASVEGSRRILDESTAGYWIRVQPTLQRVANRRGQGAGCTTVVKGSIV